MASRNSFLDSPSFRRITTPTQRRAVESRRRSSGFRGGSGGSSIRRETPAERQQRERQERLQSFQSQLAPKDGSPGIDLTPEETQAILEGRPVSEVRQQVNTRIRRQGFASLQRDLSRSGTRLTAEEAELIAEGDADPFEVRQDIERRRGRQFASQQDSFVTAGDTRIRTSEAFSERVAEDVDSGRLASAQRSIRANRQQDFASEVGLGGASFVGGGQRVVTPEGESVGGASTTEFASFIGGQREPSRLVTESGRDVTPIREVSTGGVIRADTRRQGVVAEFGRGFVSGFADPASASQEIRLNRGRAGSQAGQAIGFALSSASLGLAGAPRGAISGTGAVFGGTGRASEAVGRTFGFVRGAGRNLAARAGIGAGARQTIGTGFRRVAIGAEVGSFAAAGAIDVVSGRSSVSDAVVQQGSSLIAVNAPFRAVTRTAGFRRGFTAADQFGDAAVDTAAATVRFSPEQLRAGSSASAMNDIVRLDFARDARRARFVTARSGEVPSSIDFFTQSTPQRNFISPSDFRNTVTFPTNDNLVQTSFSVQNAPVQNPDFDLAEIRDESGRLIGATRLFRGKRNLPVSSGVTLEAANLIAQSGFSRQTFDFSDGRPRAISFGDELRRIRLGESDSLVTKNPRVLETFFDNRGAVRLPIRINPEPISGNRGDLRRQLARLDRWGVRDLEDSTFFPNRFDLRGRGQTGLESFGDLSAPQVAGLLPSPAPRVPFPPVGNRIFFDVSGGLATGAFARSTGRTAGRLGVAPPSTSSRRGSRGRVRGSSRSRLGIQNQFIPQLNFGSRTNQLGASGLDVFSGQGIGNQFDIGRVQDVSRGLDVGTVQDIGLVQDSSFRFDTGITPTPITPTRRPPRRPPRTPNPRTPRVPDFDLPQLNFGLSQRRTGSSRSGRREEFSPSLVANFLGITGERSRVSTGIEIRPII